MATTHPGTVITWGVADIVKGNSFTPGQNAVRDDGSGNRVEK